MLPQTGYQQQRKTTDTVTVNESSFSHTSEREFQQGQVEQEAFKQKTDKGCN